MVNTVMEIATYLLLAYSFIVFVSLVVSAVRHPVRGTGGPADLGDH